MTKPKTVAKECIKARGLIVDDGLVAKVAEFQELLDVRHSVMLLGPGGCGKTSIWEVLRDCHNHGKEKRVAVTEMINQRR